VGSDQVLERQLDRFQVVIGIRIRRDGLSSDDCIVCARPTLTPDSFRINLRFYLWLQPSANCPQRLSYTGPFGETPLAPGQDPLLDRYHLPGPRLRANESAFWKTPAINRLKGSETPITRVAVP
jgi:hypothetical protein